MVTARVVRLAAVSLATKDLGMILKSLQRLRFFLMIHLLFSQILFLFLLFFHELDAGTSFPWMHFCVMWFSSRTFSARQCFIPRMGKKARRASVRAERVHC